MVFSWEGSKVRETGTNLFMDHIISGGGAGLLAKVRSDCGMGPNGDGGGICLTVIKRGVLGVGLGLVYFLTKQTWSNIMGSSSSNA